MTAFLQQASIDRGARHVGRLRMRAPDRSDRPRTQMLVEEALRLTTLPGEDQGRVYCFRRLRLPLLDEALPPRQWSLWCSQALVAAAHGARPVRDAAAPHADAVYFDDVNAPYRSAIERLVRGEHASEWFWRAATSVSADLSAPARLELLLEHWQARPAGWIAVARELLPELDVSQARRFVELLTPRAASLWLSRWGNGPSPEPATAPPVPLRRPTERLLQDVTERHHPTDPRLLFFAALAVVEACPGIVQDSRLPIAAGVALDVRAVAPRANGAFVGSKQVRERDDERSPVDDDSMPALLPRGVADSETTALEGTHDRAPGVRSSRRLEARTQGAGLYFMLHVLRHLGIEDAIAAHPSLVVTHFVVRVLLRLAARAHVGDEDPSLRPLREELAGTRTRHTVDPIVIPQTLAALRRVRPTPDASERLWACAVRRWCRKVVDLRTAEIVTRTGFIRTTPSSMDITLPMSAVDVRIRRAGLDLDPGFVPWFGRVVHFHYDAEGAP
jgi:hypothetical protein